MCVKNRTKLCVHNLVSALVEPVGMEHSAAPVQKSTLGATRWVRKKHPVYSQLARHQTHSNRAARHVPR